MPETEVPEQNDYSSVDSENTVPMAPVSQEETKSSKKNLFVLIVVSFASLAGVVAGYIFINDMLIGKEEVTVPEIAVAPVEISEPSPFSQITEMQDSSGMQETVVAQIKEEIEPDIKMKRFLSSRSNNFGIFADLVPQGEVIEKADYSPLANSVALITRGEYEGVPTHDVYMYDFDASNLVVLYGLDVVEVAFANEPGRVYRIQDVAFSDDGKFLAFVATYKVFIYDLENNHLSELLDSEAGAAEQNNLNFFTYFAPIFSPDNSMLSVGKAYYEGSSNFVFDIVNKEILGLPFYNYTSGEYIIDWIGNSLLVQRHHVDEADKQNGLFLVTPKEPTLETPLYTSAQMPFDKAVVTESAIYIFSGVLSEINRVTGEHREVLSAFDLWPDHITGENRFWELFLDLEDNLYLKFSNGESFEVYLIDIQEAGTNIHKMLLD